MIRINVICKALAWVFDNADDGGYPIDEAVKKFELTGKESDTLRDLHHELHSSAEYWARWDAEPGVPDDRTDLEAEEGNEP